MSHSHARRRYLLAKQSVDDRARSRRVQGELLDTVPERPTVVEAGSGVGTGAAALLDWDITPESYRGVDADDEIVAFARTFVPQLLRHHGYTVTGTATGYRLDGGTGSRVDSVLGGGGTPPTISFEAGDALTALPGTDADLLLAQSFLDLVPLVDGLDAIHDTLAPGGLAYAPLTFDGVTLFQPNHPADEHVTSAYHDEIDGVPGRDSRAGRRLLDCLGDREERLLAVASSDWIVRPVDGQYRDDERYFVGSILEFVADAVAGVDGAEDWLVTRREQLADGELTFVAHGYDLLWQRPP